MSDLDADDDSSITPPRKKRACHTPWLDKIHVPFEAQQKGASYAFCTVCSCDLQKKSRIIVRNPGNLVHLTRKMFTLGWQVWGKLMKKSKISRHQHLHEDSWDVNEGKERGSKGQGGLSVLDNFCNSTFIFKDVPWTGIQLQNHSTCTALCVYDHYLPVHTQMI